MWAVSEFTKWLIQNRKIKRAKIESAEIKANRACIVANSNVVSGNQRHPNTREGEGKTFHLIHLDFYLTCVAHISAAAFMWDMSISVLEGNYLLGDISGHWIFSCFLCSLHNNDKQLIEQLFFAHSYSKVTAVSVISMVEFCFFVLFWSVIDFWGINGILIQIFEVPFTESTFSEFFWQYLCIWLLVVMPQRKKQAHPSLTNVSLSIYLFDSN